MRSIKEQQSYLAYIPDNHNLKYIFQINRKVAAIMEKANIQKYFKYNIIYSALILFSFPVFLILCTLFLFYSDTYIDKIIYTSLVYFFLLLFLSSMLGDKINTPEKNMQHAYHQLAFENATQGIAYLTHDLNIIALNPSMADLLEISVDNLENQNWYRLANLSHQSLLEKQYTSEIIPAVEAHGFWHGISKMVTKSGKVMHVNCMIFAASEDVYTVYLHEANIDKTVFREISSLRDQLYQAQRREVVGKLAGGLAHDFNNLLATITGFADLLVKDLPKDQDVHRFASRILSASRHAKELVVQMLSFNRVTITDFNRLNISRIIDESVSLLAGALPPSTHLTFIDEMQNPSGINANATQLHQVVMNLVVNANDALAGQTGNIEVRLFDVPQDHPDIQLLNPTEIKAIRYDNWLDIAEDNQAYIRATTGQLTKSEQYACLSIQDNGPGMTQYILQKIFDPFFTTKAAKKSSGLGLSVTRSILNQHHAGVIVRTKRHQGTVFSIFFPVTSIIVEDNQKTSTKADENPLEGNVLIIDDDISVGDMLSTNLERFGMEVSVVEGAEEALAVLDETPQHWDLIITDQTMPGMTGIDFIRKIRNSDTNIPIILYSGDIQNVSEKNATAIGASAYLAKPIQIDDMVNTIKSVMHSTAHTSDPVPLKHHTQS